MMAFTFPSDPMTMPYFESWRIYCTYHISLLCDNCNAWAIAHRVSIFFVGFVSLFAVYLFFFCSIRWLHTNITVQRNLVYVAWTSFGQQFVCVCQAKLLFATGFCLLPLLLHKTKSVLFFPSFFFFSFGHIWSGTLRFRPTHTVSACLFCVNFCLNTADGQGNSKLHR